MMQNSVRLEGFDPPVEPGRILPFDSSDVGRDIGVSPAVADPMLDPEPVEVSPEDLRAAEEAAALQSLASTLATMTQHVDALHAGLGEQLSAAVGDAVIKTLPTVLEDGFAAEIAEVTRSIFDRLAEATLQLKVAPLHHDHVVAAFEGLDPGLPVEIIDDESLSPGQARLQWAAGGAEFDAEEWSAAARIALRRHLEHLSTRRRDDD
ncbi:MAG: hypothetical protein AAFV19_16900 [Pseudomonadota bacterium]